MTEKEILTFGTDIIEESVEWLWYPYLPLGAITIMQGNPGIGKTMLALKIASALSKGKSLPGDTSSREPIHIIYNTAENGLGNTILPRLRSAGADLNRIHNINERVNTISMTDERLGKDICELGAKLLILDPIQAYLGAKIDMNRANEVRPIFAHLGRVAEENECAVLLIGHLGKNQMYSELQGLLGSTDQVAAARSVLTVTKHQNNNTLLLNHTKSSLAPRGKSLTFSIDENGKIVWGDFIEGNDKVSEEKITKIDAAKNFLKDILSEHAISQIEIQAKADELGISKRTLDEAKAQLGVKSFKKGNMWSWVLS